jgi:hypothetical protein
VGSPSCGKKAQVHSAGVPMMECRLMLMDDQIIQLELAISLIDDGKLAQTVRILL